MRAERHEHKKRSLFLDRLSEILDVSPQQAEAVASREAWSSLRVNRLSARTPQDISSELESLGAELEAIDWCADAYHLLSDKKIVSESDLFQRGHVYLQNASSLIPPIVLDPSPGAAILDVCSAPGGKAAHLAALIRNQGELWVNDAIKPRVRTLREILSTFYVETASITEYPGQYLNKYIDRQFHRILLDAQCSGEGMIDLERPRSLKYWSTARIDKFSYLQKKMLVSAFKLLEPGGTLVYCTCTYAPEENEEPVDRLLRIFSDASVARIDLDLPNVRPGLSRWQGRQYDPRLRHALRVVPNRWMEAFFVCKLVKTSHASGG